MTEPVNREEIVEGVDSGRVKGGFSVTLRSGVRAFLPGSQADLRPVREPDKLLGRSYRFEIIKHDERGGSVVVSRRALLEKERDAEKTKTLELLEEGKLVRGVVKSLAPYGVFVDLGGVDGLLHVTNMTKDQAAHPEAHFKIGREVSVQVLKFNPETERISLGVQGGRRAFDLQEALGGAKKGTVR